MISMILPHLGDDTLASQKRLILAFKLGGKGVFE